MDRRLLVLLVLLAACTRKKPDAMQVQADPASGAIDAGKPRDRVQELAARLRAQSVTDDDFARRVLYSWTTDPQVEDLRKHGVLLTADASTGEFTSPFSATMFARAGIDPIAKLLHLHPALVKRRYAWPAAWPTRVPLGAVEYGDALVRVVLRADAIVGRFDGDAWSFRTLDGQSVSEASIVADPSRLAAVLHVSFGYREYVLVNESMVEEWSVGTPEIRAEIDDEIALLTIAMEARHALDVDAGGTAQDAWTSVSRGADLRTRWNAALAFDHDQYLPIEESLDTLLAKMRDYSVHGDPIRRRPSLAFKRGPLLATTWCLPTCVIVG